MKKGCFSFEKNEVCIATEHFLEDKGNLSADFKK